MYSLEKLTMNSNKLTELPVTFGNLKRLSVLELRSNMLESICTEISDCFALAKVDLSHNHLHKLPTSLHSLLHLKVFFQSIYLII